MGKYLETSESKMNENRSNKNANDQYFLIEYNKKHLNIIKWIGFDKYLLFIAK